MLSTQTLYQLLQTYDKKVHRETEAVARKLSSEAEQNETTFINSVRANYKNMSAGFGLGGLDTMSSLNYFAWSLQPGCAMFYATLTPWLLPLLSK